MSDYSEIWFEMHRAELERGFLANSLRKKMLKELSPDDMIRIIFEHHISGLSDSDIIKLSEQYLELQ